MLDYKEAANLALNTVRRLKTTYADVRIVYWKEENLRVKNMLPESINYSESLGIGVRVLKNGAWGFAACANLSKSEIERISGQAVKIALASSKVKGKDVILSPLKAIKGSYKTPILKNPFLVSREEKLTFLFSLTQAMGKVKRITSSQAQMGFRWEHKYFANSEGSEIEQEIFHSGAGILAIAMGEHREMGRRSFPSSQDGQYEAKGYELIESLQLLQNAERNGEEAVALLSAKKCPVEVKDIILDGSKVSLQIHESIGHALELDRVLGAEANLSGTRFATLDKLNKLKYASEIVNITADATLPGGLGTFGYDDEGVPAQRVDLIKEGILCGYLTSRELAPLLKQKSMGAMRADGWENIPLIRMTNTNLLPGKMSLEEMIADTEDGLYLSTPSSWSIDETRENFKFGTEIGWEIKGGKLGEMIKNPTYSGSTITFWNSCDAIANEKYWKIWGTPNCGKGQPGQNARVGQGASPVRFRKVKVGE